MELVYFLVIILAFAVVGCLSWFISRKVFKRLTIRGNSEAKLIAAVVFLVAFLVILVSILYIMDLNHAFDKYF